MNRTKFNALVDGLALLSFIFLTSTGLLLKFKLPAHSGSSTLWGYTRHDWGAIHTWISFALMFFMLFHLALHWKWIVTVVKGKAEQVKKPRLIGGVVILTVLIVLSVAPFFMAVSQGRGGQGERRQHGVEENQVEEHSRSNSRIKGSTTLAHIEQLTGVTTKEFLSSLNIPGNQPGDTRIGPLCRQYGIEMSQVRQQVEEFQER
jgi:Domain of unknown function (DUF4405)